MVSKEERDTIVQSALDHIWLGNTDWVKLAEKGGPIIITEGEGIRVTDAEGRTWIDATGGNRMLNVGYGRKEIAEAARDQMSKMHFSGPAGTTAALARLAEKIGEIAPGSLERIFPCTTGSEANEQAVRITRAYHKRNGESGRYKIISRRGSYHGALGLTMWLGGETADRTDYEPSYPGMVYAPQPNPYRCELGGQTPSECAVRCAEAIEDLIQFHGPKTVAAVIAEPVAQPPGAVVPGDEYWPMLRHICDRYGVLLIADEITTGFGRTGKLFAVNHWDVVPDIMTVIAGGYSPVSGAIVTREVADVFASQENTLYGALTFGGHPVSAVAAVKNIEILLNEGMVENSARTGAYFLERLQGLKADHPIIGDVRGLGLLLGIEMVSDRDTKARFAPGLNIGERLTEKFRQQGLLVQASDHAVTFSPPLCTTRSDVDEMVAGANRAFGALEQEL